MNHFYLCHLSWEYKGCMSEATCCICQINDHLSHKYCDAVMFGSKKVMVIYHFQCSMHLWSSKLLFQIMLFCNSSYYNVYS